MIVHGKEKKIVELGKKIIKIRKENNLTQEDFAEKYNVTRQTISSWENSKSYPDLETLVKISDDFDISLDVLLKDDKKMIEKVSKSQKDGKKYEILLVILAVIIVVFIVINIVWFVGVKTRYMSLYHGFKSVEVGKGSNYEKVKNGYKYIVKDTGYLGNSGFANVSLDKDFVIDVDDQENEITDNTTRVTLYVWPENFSGYTYGIDIDGPQGWHQINVDKNGTYIPGDNIDDKLDKLIVEYREEINKLFELADKMWNIR